MKIKLKKVLIKNRFKFNENLIENIKKKPQ